MKWAMKYRKLYYLIEETIKSENGMPTSTEARQEDIESACAFSLEHIHKDNISLINMLTNPKEMWDALKSSHLHNSSGYLYFHLLTPMSLPIPDIDGINNHLSHIKSIGDPITKLCPEGKISIEDIQIAALTSSLPQDLASTTAPFEQKKDVQFKEVSDAVRSVVVKNRTAWSIQSSLPPRTKSRF